jgi:hypothetical protein
MKCVIKLNIHFSVDASHLLVYTRSTHALMSLCVYAAERKVVFSFLNRIHISVRGFVL